MKKKGMGEVRGGHDTSTVYMYELLMFKNDNTHKMTAWHYNGYNGVNQQLSSWT